MTTGTMFGTSSNSTTTQETLGLVAGEGQLPVLLARSAKERGYKIVAFALSETARDAVAPLVDKVVIIAPGQLGRNTQLFHQNGVKCAVLIGKVPKINLLHNMFKLDWTAVKEFSKLTNFSDDSIQRAVGNYIEANGVKVLTQSEFLRHLFADYGVLTNRQPTAAEYVDVEYGMRIAKEIARLDIGQTVVVRNQMIMAVEAIDGTDETIKRAVRLAKGPVVVCKVSKVNPDERFDTPTVGMSTLQAMVGQKPGGVLAIGAGETLVVEREEMIAFAEANGIAVLAV